MEHSTQCKLNTCNSRQRKTFASIKNLVEVTRFSNRDPFIDKESPHSVINKNGVEIVICSEMKDKGSNIDLFTILLSKRFEQKFQLLRAQKLRISVHRVK